VEGAREPRSPPVGAKKRHCCGMEAMLCFVGSTSYGVKRRDGLMRRIKGPDTFKLEVFLVSSMVSVHLG
jgi:hypothetical protein